MVSDEYIKELLTKTFPGLRVFARGDLEYILPTLEDVVREVIAVGELNPVGGADCDDYALHLHSKIKWNFPHWAFGEAWGLRIRGQDLNHYLNVVITNNRGVVLFEPQVPGDWWIPQDDKILWVRI